MDNFIEAVNIYTELGWSCIPLETRGKKPYRGYKWKKQALTIDSIENYPSNCNVGVILGERSNGLIDLDFDCAEAGIMARSIFPELPSFGRESSPLAHKILRCGGAVKTKRFELPPEFAAKIGFTEKSVIMEIRANGGQTMFPPSTHPCGEIIEWHDGLPNDIPCIELKELERRSALCAFAAVVLKAYPLSSGSRDQICMALCGALIRAGYESEEVDRTVQYIASQKNDEEAEARGKASSSKERLDNGEDVTGLPKLCELLEIKELETTLSKWLYSDTKRFEMSEADKKVEEINNDFFVVRDEGGKCLVGKIEKNIFSKNIERDVLHFQSKADFSSWFSNVLVTVDYTNDGKPIQKPLGTFWWGHKKRRQYERVIFAPGSKLDNKYYNLWRGYGVEPYKKLPKKLIRHVYKILANEDKEAFRYIIKWCAWAVQNPDLPAEVAIVLRGGKGTGKGTFCNAMVNLFGHHGLAISSSNHLTGRFNGHMRDCVLLFADEAIVPNDKKSESTLKSLITEPMLLIEGKNKDPIPCANYLHIMMASNDDWVVPASSDERRYAIFDISNEMAQRGDWFGPINEELRNGGLEGLLWLLLNLKLDDWHPRKGIPANMALKEQQVQSLKGLDEIWFDWISTGEGEGEMTEYGKIAVTTKHFAQLARSSDKAAGEYLKSMGCTQKRLHNGRGWEAPPLSEARKIWDNKKFEYSWNKTDEWFCFKRNEPPF